MRTNLAALCRKINEEYGITVSGLKPKGPVFTLTSPAGEYLLKSVPLEATAILSLHETLEQLKGAGFNHLSTLITTKNGRPFFGYQSKNFIITPWFVGSHPSFSNDDHLETLGSLYGRLHRTALSLKVRPVTADFLIKDLQEKTKFLADLQNDLKTITGPNRIDRKIREMLPYFRKQALFCCANFEAVNSGFKNSTLPVGFCHNDPAPRNIIINKDFWFLIDFDLSGAGPILQELGNLILRVLRSNDWSSSKANLVYRAYLQERSLTELEARLLPYSFFFPRGFWRICQQRFVERLNWGERRFASRLWRIGSEEGPRSLFLNSLLRKLEQGGIND